MPIEVVIEANGTGHEGVVSRHGFRLSVLGFEISAVLQTLRDTSRMRKLLGGLSCAVVLVLLTGFRETARPAQAGPQYTSEGQLKFPEEYREWVYLTSGFDMSYNPTAQAASHHVFDNVFVNPTAYKGFVETGKWPDQTVLVLEIRGAEGKGSINQSGNFQSTDSLTVEVHIKDSGRFPDKWAFFGFGKGKVGRLIPQPANCYSCHAEHAAVDTTFVQFYPTLLPLAKSKGTLSASYLAEASVTK